MPSLSTTVQTRIPDHLALNAMGVIFGVAERRLHAAFEADRTWRDDLQTGFYGQFGITSHHLDHVRKSLLAKVDAVMAASKVQASLLGQKVKAKRKQVEKKRKLVLKTLATADKTLAIRDAALSAIAAAAPDLKSIKSTIAARALKRTLAAEVKLAKAGADLKAAIVLRKKLKAEIHQHQRRIGNLEARADVLRARASEPSLAFGTRRLFAAQNDLPGNGYADHDAWLSDWKESRSSQFYVEGGSHETDGNRFVRLDPQQDGTFSLELRLPKSAAHLADGSYKSGTHSVPYVMLHGLRFEHGRDQVASWLIPHRDGSGSGRPITYRFVRDERGWRVMVTGGVEYAEPKRYYGNGALGVDLNEHKVVVTRADRAGNYLRTWTFPLCLYGKTEGQRQDMIRKVCAKIVALAVELKLPLVVEDLDFAKKRAELACGEHPRRARMLSSFACTAFSKAMESAARRGKVHLKVVNPAYTSLIGRISYAPRFGLSVHAAAALSIARRAMGKSERAPTPMVGDDGKPVIAVRLDNGDHVTLPGPVRSPRRHVWSTWSALSKGMKAVHAARMRARRKSRSAGTSVGSNSDVPVPVGRGGLPPPRVPGGTSPALSSRSQIVSTRDRLRPVRVRKQGVPSPQVSR